MIDNGKASGSLFEAVNLSEVRVFSGLQSPIPISWVLVILHKIRWAPLKDVIDVEDELVS